MVSEPVVRTLPALTPPHPHTLSGQSDTICLICGLKDDGSPMIGWDNCEDWLHWKCVGMYVSPSENKVWFCPNCREKARKKTKKKLKKPISFFFVSIFFCVVTRCKILLSYNYYYYSDLFTSAFLTLNNQFKHALS